MAETKKPTNKERLQEITAGIEQGIKELFESDRFMSYLRTMSRFHTYSVNNQMLIHMQMPGATRVAGFNKWKNQFERHVKKGEKGLKIIAPTPFKKKIEEMKLDPDTRLPVLDREGKTVMEEKEVEIPMFRPVTVFDVSQTEGKPLPQLAAELHGNVQHYEVFIEALRRSSPVPMGFEKMQGMDGYFSEEQQRVAICEGMSEVQTVCAAVHEITHAKLHNYEKARLEAARGDETKEPPKPKDRRTEEVEAESVSYAVCQYYGIETGENSFGYIASWSNGKELPELRASLETIGRTASSLITDIDRHFRDICKERGIDLTAQEQVAAEPEADTLERFATDFCEYTRGLHNWGQELPPDFEKTTAEELANALNYGDFADTRQWLRHAIAIGGGSSPEWLLYRLDKLEQGRDRRLQYKAHTNLNMTGLNDCCYIRAFEKTAEGLIPRELVYIGTVEECQGWLKDMEEGYASIHDLRTAVKLEQENKAARRSVDGENRQSEPLWHGKREEDFTEQDVLLFVADTDMQIYGYVTAMTLEVIEKAGYRYENGSLQPAPENEAVYRLEKQTYLHVQTCDTGFHYTFYEGENPEAADSGDINAPELSLDAARDEILARKELIPESTERVPSAMMDVLNPPQMPHVQPPQGSPYDVSVYSDRQWTEIQAGLEKGLDISLYSDPSFNAMQMNRIRTGLENGLPATLYAKTAFSWEQMELVGKLICQGYDVSAVHVGGRVVDFTDPSLPLSDMERLQRQMEYDAIPKMLYTPEQWAEIRRGMDAGYDVSQYADPGLPASVMADLRDKLNPDTLEQFAADLYDYMAGLYDADLMDYPFSHDPKEKVVAYLSGEYHQGTFADSRSWLAQASKLDGAPPTADLQRRLDHLEQAREANLVYEMNTAPRMAGAADRHFVQAFEQAGRRTFIPREIVYIGSPERCEELLKSLHTGITRITDIHDTERAELMQSENYPDALERGNLYVLDESVYLHLQANETGYDYTLYDVDTLRAMDDGQIERADIPRSTACLEICGKYNLGAASIKYAPAAMIEALQETERKAAQIEAAAFSHVLKAIKENRLGSTVFITGIRTCQSMDANPEKPKHDVLVEYGGPLSEDDFYNLLHNQEYAINGIPVEFKPITPEQSGSIREYLQQLKEPDMKIEVKEKAPASEMKRAQVSVLPVAPELALDEYPMPDPVLTVENLENCGYLDGDLLPLSKDRALELYEQELTVYAILDGGEASMTFDQEDIEDHGGIFAVPREEWGASKEFIDRLDDRQNHQQEREHAFLSHKGDCFAIYQLHDGDDLHYVRYEPLDRLLAAGGEVLKENYNLIYTAPLTVERDTETCLHKINNQFNLNRPEDFGGHSLSISDIIAIKRDGKVSCHYVDSGFDFTMLPDFLKPENYLKNTEMALEDDYGMIDGIINNGPKQPTVAELEAHVKAGEQISLLDLANAVHKEQGDKKKSVVERLKQQPPQQDRKKTAPKKSAEREL